jgi:hypothetical protein
MKEEEMVSEGLRLEKRRMNVSAKAGLSRLSQWLSLIVTEGEVQEKF